MKQLFTFLLLLNFSFPVAAQQVIFDEDFESFQGYQIPGWTQQAYGYPWETGYAEALGSHCFQPDDNPTKVAGVKDNWACSTCYVCNYTFADSLVRLITPAQDLSGLNAAALEFDSYFLGTSKNGKTETATIEVSVDAGLSWTPVLQVQPDGAGFHRWYADLNAFAGYPDVRIGFRYQDKGEIMSGWMIDNIRIFLPAPNDISVQSVTPRDSLQWYEVVGDAVIHKAEILNYGTNPITGFTLKYKKGNGPVYSHFVTGLQLQPLQKILITHPHPDSVLAVTREKVTMWAELPGDNIHNNDTGYTYLHGAAFMPKKRLVIEEGAATWSIYGLRGWTLMNGVPGNDLDVTQISIHGEPDPMGNDAYDDYLYYLDNYFIPYLLFDRIVNVKPDSFYQHIQKMKGNFGFADLELTGGLNGSAAWINAVIKPAVNLSGDFRLVMVITEDSVRGTGPGFEQRNGWAGNNLGLGQWMGLENKPDPVPASDMFYNFVARTAYPTPEGIINMLPQQLSYQSTYNYYFNTQIDPSWNRDRLKAFVLLVNNNDSTILNSGMLPWMLNIHDVSASLETYGVYPNPARSVANVFFTLEQTEQIGWTLTDISGKIVRSAPRQSYFPGRNDIPVAVEDLTPGIYFISLMSEHAKRTMKLIVLD
ncbi:MAG: T9SS type A sorting domain-containing protein [Sphingobacteriales bacterium]|nr:MAG: T9SS type A sorting domain-containing protein [Sphingobacteriales bacterium]